MSLNRVELLGRLGGDVKADPKSRATVTVASGSLAVSESYKDKTSGEWKEVTDWVQLRFFDKMAERAIQKLKKGMEVYMEGKIKTWTFERDGKKEYATAVKIEKFIITRGGAAPKAASAASDDVEENESVF